MNLLYTDFEYYANVSEADGFQHYARLGNHTFIGESRDANKCGDSHAKTMKMYTTYSVSWKYQCSFFL